MLSCYSSHCPSDKCVSAANAVSKSTDNFRNSHLNVNSINWSNFLFSPSFVRLIRAVVCIRLDFVIGH